MTVVVIVAACFPFGVADPRLKLVGWLAVVRPDHRSVVRFTEIIHWFCLGVCCCCYLIALWTVCHTVDFRDRLIFERIDLISLVLYLSSLSSYIIWRVGRIMSYWYVVWSYILVVMFCAAASLCLMFEGLCAW